MTTSTRRFATLDLHSGYVFWVGDAESPEQACTLTDVANHASPHEYEECCAIDRDRATWSVYEVPEGFDVTDGQSGDQIRLVEACDHIGMFGPVADECDE